MDENQLLDLANKNIKLFLMMNQWTRLLQEKKTIIDYFVEKKYFKIAIYGFGIVGETLERELRGSNVEISYIVDRDAEYMYGPARMIKPTDDFEDVDIMVVTTIDSTGELDKYLKNKCEFDVIALEDIINEL